MKYLVGDIVRIINYWSEGMDGNCEKDSEMYLEYSGKFATITDVSSIGPPELLTYVYEIELDKGDWYWYESMLLPANEIAPNDVMKTVHQLPPL